MRIGVAGFQPARLEQAMRARGLNQVSLAQLINRSTSTLSKWKSGQQLPEREALEHLARALNLPDSIFLRPMPKFGDAPKFNRSVASATELARSKAGSRLEWAEELSLLLEEWVDYPAVNVLQRDHAVTLLSDADVETAALDLRRAWNLGLGPVHDVVLALENAGVFVVREEIGYLKLDGTSHWFEANGRPYVFLVADKANGARSRFDACHEIGHVVLHRGVDAKTLDDNFQKIENQAHMFAGAFLLPAETFGSEVSAWPTLDTFAVLKKRWRVSIAAMIMRCKHLEIVDDSYATRLWKNYSARGWRRREPFDDEIAFEKPRLLARAVRLVLDEGVMSKAALAQNAGLSAGDIESLSGLPDGYLSNDAGNVIDLQEVRLRRA